MMIPRSFGALCALFLSAQSALGCACCVEKGERFLQKQALDAIALSELALLAASGPAVMFVTACGLECVRGIDAPAYEYNVEIQIDEGGVRFNLADQKSSLHLPFAGTYTRFGVDIRPLSKGSIPDFYSELRFAGRVSATGEFSAADGAGAEFVLAGWTNWCWVASDFTHWSLAVESQQAEFRLFGGIAE